MKPTSQEKQWLRDYLYEALNYRETFDEVYDHILLALEREPAQPYFESTVYKIIDEDFGGSINMLNLEVDCERATKNEVNAQYWQTFFSWFKLPKVAYILIPIVALFFIRPHSLAGIIIMVSIGLLVGIIPLVTVFVRRLMVRFVNRDKKHSIRDSAFKWLAYWYILIGMFVINPLVKFIEFCLKHWFNYSDKLYMQSIPRAILGVFLTTIAVVHMLTLIELFRNEYKTKMIQA